MRFTRLLTAMITSAEAISPIALTNNNAGDLTNNKQFGNNSWSTASRGGGGLSLLFTYVHAACTYAGWPNHPRPLNAIGLASVTELHID